MIDAFSTAIEGITDPSIAEGMGLREALSWIKMKQMSNVIVEMDAQIIVKAMHNYASSASYLGLVIDDCKDISRSITNLCVVFVKRSANQVAHLLARVSGSMSGLMFWGSNPPSFLLAALAADISS